MFDNLSQHGTAFTGRLWVTSFAYDQTAVCSLMLLTTSRAGETGGGGGRGDRSPGPQKFHLLGGTEGDPTFLKMGSFDWYCAVFRQFSIFAYTLWALLALGALFRKGPQGLVPPPPPRNSFIQAWQLDGNCEKCEMVYHVKHPCA